MSRYFSKPFEPFGEDMNVKVDLPNYATKADIKNISDIDNSSFTWKANLASLKTKVDKLDVDKLIPVPLDLSKLSDTVKYDVVKMINCNMYDKLVTKVNNIDTSGIFLKTKYETVKSDLENKIADTSGLLKIAVYNTKITEIENKIQSTSGLATNFALTAVVDKIPNVT